MVSKRISTSTPTSSVSLEWVSWFLVVHCRTSICTVHPPYMGYKYSSNRILRKLNKKKKALSHEFEISHWGATCFLRLQFQDSHIYMERMKQGESDSLSLPGYHDLLTSKRRSPLLCIGTCFYSNTHKVVSCGLIPINYRPGPDKVRAGSLWTCCIRVSLTVGGGTFGRLYIPIWGYQAHARYVTTVFVWSGRCRSARIHN